MRRALRCLLYGLTVSSILFCLATCALWVRSYWRTDRYTRNWPNGTESVRSLRGRLVWSRMGAAGVTATGTTTLTGPSGGIGSAPVVPEDLASFYDNHPAGFARVHRADARTTLDSVMHPQTTPNPPKTTPGNPSPTLFGPPPRSRVASASPGP